MINNLKELQKKQKELNKGRNKNNKIDIFSIIFENIYYLGETLKKALLQEMAAILDGEELEKRLIENLKEYHEEITED